MRLVFLVFFFVFNTQAAIAGSVDDFIREATELQLAQHPIWLALLHYKREVLSNRVISQADDDRFFLSESGKTQPQAELEADIKAFLKPAERGHKQCSFPARWFWLKQQLGLSSKYDVSCPRLDAWLANVATQRLTLVFPSMYLGNPGSMFGHTFLRFDGDEALLLSQALNYAAAIDPDDNLLSYAYNGLFGGYKGVFLMRSYFEMVQLYSNIENRDIWEYQLDYSPAEIKQLARHTWELIDIRFDYFFFRENCSYRLLAMLDTVRPQAELTADSAFLLSAVPVDTVRALDEKNLIKQRHYRPSLASQLQTDFAQHQSGEAQWVLQLAEGDQHITGIPVTDILAQIKDESTQIAVLEQAYTLLQFRHQADGSRAEEILTARSRLTGKKLSHVNTPTSPELGHASARFAIGGGRQNQRSYVDIVLRPAFHDLVDAPLGYVEGSEINILDTRFRWFPDDDLVLLESLRFFNVVSLNPVSDWYTPLSWQLDIGLERMWFDKNNSDMAFVTRGGAGYSTRLSATTVFAMAVLEVGISDEYAKSYNALAGIQLGASILFEGGQVLLLAEEDEAFSGFELDKASISAELQFNLAVNSALRLAYRKTRYQALDDENWDDEDWFIRLQWYF
jgi:hypothetical protein